MKKISILFYLVLVLLTFMSCEEQDGINPQKSTESQIAIDVNSIVHLTPTTSTKEQIEDDMCGDVKTTVLFAGQHKEVGELTISNDSFNLFITYTVTGNWWLKETHLFVGLEANLPLNGSGNPKIGHFPYHGEHNLTQSYTFTIPLNQLEECYVVSAHAVVVKKENGNITSSETAFGFGEKEFPGNRWGWYFEYCNQTCEEDDDDDESETCLNAFATNTTKPERSYCFNYTDNNQKEHIGWSNEFNFYLQQDKHHTLPLYAKVEKCDTGFTDNDIVKVGYADVYLFHEGIGDGMQLFTTVKYVLTNDLYELTEVNLNLNNTKYPIDLDPNHGAYNYNKTSNNWNSNTNSFEKLPWPGIYNDWDTYFIINAKVCRVNK